MDTSLKTDNTPVPLNTNRDTVIAVWLFTVAAMVFMMVVLGGVTRLTDSGLSMVEWRPVSGWLPPFGDAEWREVFAKYRSYPEYQKINAGMTLEEFEGIFWLEFLHRLWGRVIGVVFIVPLVYFVVRGWLSRQLRWRLVGAAVLGGLQGGLGWFMVKSGLVDRPDVSQYRLAAHLGLALIIYGYLLWIAFGLVWKTPANAPLRVRKFAVAVLALVFITAMSGALVAGLDAGLTYNTFPLMDGDFVPEGYFQLQPFYLNFFENIAAVQFDHRLLAEITFIAVITFWWTSRKSGLPSAVKRVINGLAAVAVLQVGLGISTLLLVVPIGLAALHQAVAVILIGFAVWNVRVTQ